MRALLGLVLLLVSTTGEEEALKLYLTEPGISTPIKRQLTVILQKRNSVPYMLTSALP
jgi:hypothetical protein